MTTEVQSNITTEADSRKGPTVYDTPAYKVRKRKLGDRREGRRLRTLDGLHVATPFVM